MKKKFLKVMFGEVSGASDFTYKINEINIADNWNPLATNPTEMGGFNFSTEDKILRWLVRGDTIYDVTIPEGAEVIECENKSTPNGAFRSNKIILSNPRKVTDEMALEFYLKSDLPELSYYKALAGLAIRGHKNTCMKLIEDKINKENIEVVISEINDFIKPENWGNISNQETFDEVMKLLKEIENSSEE